MDPMPVEPQSDIPQTNISSPLPVKHGNPLLKILIGLVLLGIGVGIGWFLANKKNISLSPKQTVSTYDECIDAKGSTIQESYPATCVTRDGTRFTQPLTEEEKQNLLPPEIDSEQADSIDTANWKTYTINILGISFMYPEDWFINKYDDSGAIRLQNYNPNSAPGREYSPELDKGKFGLVVGPFVINGVSPQFTTVAELKDLLQKENSKECFYYGDASGVRIAKDNKETSINGISVYSRLTKCSKAPDSAWVPENFLLDGKGKTIIVNPILDVSSGKDLISQILSTFKFLDN